MVDHRRLPMAITLSSGQASDKAAVGDLLAAHPAPGDVVADRGYDARAIVEMIAVHGGRGHIPTQRDRKVQRSVDAAIYRQRNLVERFFNKLKHFRSIARDTRRPPPTTSLLSSSHHLVFGSGFISPQPSPFDRLEVRLFTPFGRGQANDSRNTLIPGCRTRLDCEAKRIRERRSRICRVVYAVSYLGALTTEIHTDLPPTTVSGGHRRSG